VNDHVITMQDLRTSLKDGISAEGQNFLDAQESLLLTALDAIRGSRSAAVQHLDDVSQRLVGVEQRIARSSTDIKDMLEANKVAVLTCQMHLDIVQDIAHQLMRPLDQQHAKDSETNWLELLKTAGIVVGAFVGVSNMIAIRNIQSILQPALPELGHDQSYLRNSGPRVVSLATESSPQDLPLGDFTPLDYSDLPSANSFTEGHSSCFHAGPGSLRSFMPSSPTLSILPTLSKLAKPTKQDLGFCFSIKSITPDHTVQESRYGPPPDSLWMPPDSKVAFTVTEDTGYYHWSRGTVKKMRPSQHADIRNYGSTSMFWCHDRQAFLQVPYDCTEKNVSEESRYGGRLDWAKLTFHHRAICGRRVSLVGYGFEHSQLGTKAPRRWMPNLLPEVYEYHGWSESQVLCHLGGELSIIIGLIAFSASPGIPIQDLGRSLEEPAQGRPWRPLDLTGRGSTAKFPVACKFANIP
jgi:hypothetical protein